MTFDNGKKHCVYGTGLWWCLKTKTVPDFIMMAIIHVRVIHLDSCRRTTVTRMLYVRRKTLYNTNVAHNVVRGALTTSYPYDVVRGARTTSCIDVVRQSRTTS